MKHIMMIVGALLALFLFIIPSNGDAMLFKEFSSNDAYKRKLFLNEKSTTWMEEVQSSWKIVALGDSLTAGVGDLPGKGGYLSVLKDGLSDERFVEEVTIVNHGIGGLRSEQLKDRLLKGQFKNSITKADAVIITIGGNDLLEVSSKNFLQLSYQLIQEEENKYEDNMETIIEMILAYNPDCDIYIIGLFNPFIKWFEELNKVIDDWNDATKNIAETRTNAIFIPINDLFINTEESLLYSDQFHPNEKGYEKIGERVIQYITTKEKLKKAE